MVIFEVGSELRAWASAFQSLLDEMIGKSEAVPLPDPESARGRPFRSFNSLDEYQREVLGVA